MKKLVYIPVIVILFYCVNIFAQQKLNSQNNRIDNYVYHSENIQDSVLKNRMWEFKLYSTISYPNPYKDVVLNVHICNMDSTITYESYGFWDGDTTFRIRAYFPTVGEWKWRTSCSDTNNIGLQNKSGSVWVNEYNGTNKIYKHGGLKVSENKRFLTYADNTPFLWMGGTAWGLPMEATFDEWKSYIDDRHSKKFSVIQIAPARIQGGIWVDSIVYPTNQNGDTCFYSDDKWNPLYWQEFDKFVEYANSKEIIIVIVGLAEPVYDILSVENAKYFTRNFSARMEGYHVILSPSFDSWQAYQRDILDSIGVYLTNSRHLITQHAGHSYIGGPYNKYTQYFLDKSYLDFSLNQSGHNGGDIEIAYKKAREWNIGLYNELPKKPVINSEAYYSAGKYSEQISYKAYGGTDENARALGWLSWLSGSLGYTYGAMGIWNYGELTNDEVLIPLDTAINFVSSKQMEYMVNFFNAFAWWELEPNHSAIISSENDETKKMALAISESGKFGAAFLPDNNSITIDMSIFSNKINAFWFNTITGEFTISEQNVLNSGEHTFTPSVPGEWALLLKGAEFTTNIKYNFNWNLMSIPLATDNMNVASFFSDTTTLALKYDSNYSSVDTLFNGVGYWIKNSSSGTRSISGSKPIEPIKVKVGWNLIGVYNREVKTNQIQTVPSGIITNSFYGFENGYYTTDKLEVGKGYWVKANTQGEIKFTDTLLLDKNSPKFKLQTEPQLTFNILATDEVSDSISLTFGLDSLATNGLDTNFGELELPPMPPPGVFDARMKLQDTLITSYSDIRFLSADCYTHILQYQLGDSSNGLTLSWYLPKGVTLNIKDMVGGTMFNETFNSGEGTFRISNTNINTVKLTFCYSDVVLLQNENNTIPNKYSLLQNYPNPFNPSTVIEYKIPIVEMKNIPSLQLKVFDVLGREVTTLVNEKQKYGSYKVQFDASSLTSGIYFYTLQTGSFVKTKKMMLLK